MNKVILLIALLLAGGCATIPSPKSVTVAPQTPGVYHKVVKGQTLWKISKLYAIELDELARVNRISDASNIETGQLIFVPYRKAPPSYSAYRDDNTEDFIWPMQGRVISGFGQKCGYMINKGLNIQCHSQQDVLASSKGKVVFAADNFTGFGKTLIIDHGNGFLTVYARNSELLAKAGDLVRQGAVIARLDPKQDEAYLHFEIRKGHVAQNPYFYLSS